MLTKEQLIEALKTVKDPEINLDVWTMGLIYDLDFTDNTVTILMTYTTPFCPWGPDLQEHIKSALEDIGIKKTTITVTFNPPYKMPEELRVMLGI
jgi:metal-sulfur cluster biosynthetic enzyme